MGCQKCGYESKDNGKFCPNCGAKYKNILHLFEIRNSSIEECGDPPIHKKFILAKTYNEAEIILKKLGFNPVMTNDYRSDNVNSCNTIKKELAKRAEKKAELKKQMDEIDKEIEELEKLKA